MTDPASKTVTYTGTTPRIYIDRAGIERKLETGATHELPAVEADALARDYSDAVKEA